MIQRNYPFVVAPTMVGWAIYLTFFWHRLALWEIVVWWVIIVPGWIVIAYFTFQIRSRQAAIKRLLDEHQRRLDRLRAYGHSSHSSHIQWDDPPLLEDPDEAPRG